MPKTPLKFRPIQDPRPSPSFHQMTLPTSWHPLTYLQNSAAVMENEMGQSQSYIHCVSTMLLVSKSSLK